MELKKKICGLCRCCQKVVENLVFADTCADCLNHCVPGNCTSMGRVITTGGVGKE